MPELEIVVEIETPAQAEPEYIAPDLIEEVYSTPRWYS
jgi:hypothetical protein